MPQPHLRSGPSFARMKIGLLGGSFNPAHEGHLEMSEYALKRLGLDQVWWLVSPQNPLKPVKGMAPLPERVDAARALADTAKHIVVTDLEKDLGTRFTVDTMKALKKRFRRTDFVWLMGADNFRQLPRWRRWQQIFGLVPVAVFRRPDYAAGRGGGKPGTRFANAWHRVHLGKKLAKMKPPAWIVLDNRLNLQSATKIRAARGK
ncbi:MAG: nicotinate-nucleotide adenylyltransferase [Bdellovibrionales bacterium]